MAFVFVPNRKGIAALLRTPEVAADLQARAERVADAAHALSVSGRSTYVVRSEIGPVRARSAVITASVAARVAEAKYHRLLSALDAAR